MKINKCLGTMSPDEIEARSIPHQQQRNRQSYHELSSLLLSSYNSDNCTIGTLASMETTIPTETCKLFIYSPLATSPPSEVSKASFRNKIQLTIRQEESNENIHTNCVNNNHLGEALTLNRSVENTPTAISSLQSYLSLNRKDQDDDNFIDIETSNRGINAVGESNLLVVCKNKLIASEENEATESTRPWRNDCDELEATDRTQLLSKNNMKSSSRRSSSRRSMYSSYRSLHNYPCGILNMLWARVDENAFQFGIRMAVVLTICALFTLIHTKTMQYPDAMFILVTSLFVCWFPSLDAASVIEKVIQRLIGTFIGAIIGLTCGFLSIIVYEEEGDIRFEQSVFLGICFFIFNFLIVFLSAQLKVGGATVINRFSYATILCVLTFCICMLPFANDEKPKWKHGVWRIINVVIGCILGAVGAIVIFPKSTNDLLFEKTSKQVRLAGEASEALLQTAADYFAGQIKLTRWADELTRQPLESSMRWKFKSMDSSVMSDDCSSVDVDVNVAMKKYEDAISDWRATKALFPIVQYDPFAVDVSRHPSLIENIHGHNYKGNKVHMEIARTLARALRIQTTIMVLDGMIRNDAQYEFTNELLLLFASTGKLIREMLTVPLDLHVSNDAASQLFDKLEEIRDGVMIEASRLAEATEIMELKHTQSIQQLKKNLLVDVQDDYHLINSHNMNDGKTGSPQRKTHRKQSSSFNSLIVLDLGEDDVDEDGRGIPKNATNEYENTLFFLQLVEHLILRSLRLYQAWKLVEIKCE